MKDKIINILERKVLIYAIVICAIVPTSCTSPKSFQQALRIDKSYCNKQQIPAYVQADLPKPLHLLTLDTVLTNRFSHQSLNMANAIGILDILTTYTRLIIDNNAQATAEKRLNLMELSQQVHQKINLASLEVSAIASELDCEEERANQFAFYLKEHEGKTENQLVIGSIILGAAGAISAEVISNNSSNPNLVSGFTISISLVEASLGALMLVNKRKIEFYHSDNALSDIWTNSVVSSYFPPSIWYYLTYENPNKPEKSLAKLLVNKWQLFGQISEEKVGSKDKARALYFGKGGVYKADDLINRADMLDQTESYVTLMKQGLKTLTYEIDKQQFK